MTWFYGRGLAEPLLATPPQLYYHIKTGFPAARAPRVRAHCENRGPRLNERNLEFWPRERIV